MSTRITSSGNGRCFRVFVCRGVLARRKSRELKEQLKRDK